MKENLEKSLKRYLKRKVKITLGFITAFAIIGNVGLAADVTNPEDLNDYEKSEYYLKGFGKTSITNTGEIQYGNEKVKINIDDSDSNKYKISYSDGITNIISTYGNTTSDIKTSKLPKEYLSEETAKRIDSVLGASDKKYTNISSSLDRDIAVNELIVGNKNVTVQEVSGENNITNNGYMIAYSGQEVENGNAVNNGIIISYDSAQNATENGDVINYGYIRSQNAVSAQIVNNGNAYNYGLINSPFGQQVKQGGTGNLYNYGVIKTLDYVTSEGRYQGQYLNGNNSKAYNYGIIEVLVNGQVSQSGRKGNELYNYGTINITNNNGTAIRLNGATSYNYGLIKVIDGLVATNGAKDSKGTVHNNGVIYASGESSIFSDSLTVDNKGIVITSKDVSDKEWSKTGVTLNTSYELQNTDTATTITGERLDNNSFGDKNIGYIHSNESSDNSIVLDDIEGKTVGVVVENKNTNPVFKLDDTTLIQDSDFTGYLINGGTFIDMAGKDLTLSNTNISVVEDLQKTNGERAVAIDLGNGGSLSIMGDSQINGIIKGGENSKVETVAQKGNISTDGIEVLELKNGSADIKDINYTDVVLSGGNVKEINTDFTYTSEGKENTITIENDFIVGDEAGDYTSKDVITDNTTSDNTTINYVIKNLDNIHGNIKLGNEISKITVDNRNDYKYNGNIDLGIGDKDTFVANSITNEMNEFNFHVTNAETIELNGGDWKIGSGKLDFTSSTSREMNLKMTGNSTFYITLNDEKGGSDLSNAVEKGLISSNVDLVLSTEDESKIKYQISDKGVDYSQLSTDNYSIANGSNVVAPIFNVSSDGKNGVSMTVKSADEVGVGGYKPIYDAIVKELSSDIANKSVIDKINGMNETGEVANFVKNISDGA